MAYTVTIHNSDNELAENLISYLINLSKNSNYNFMEISDNETDSEIEQTLDKRFEHFKSHKDTYVEWETVKHRFVK